MNVRDMMRIGPVIPVIVIDELPHAVPLAQALVAGGVRVLEVTLRTPAALEAIRAMAREVEGAIVGVGTISNAADFEQALAAGARFGVSPGLTPALIEAARASSLPFPTSAAWADPGSRPKRRWLPATGGGSPPLPARRPNCMQEPRNRAVIRTLP